ADRARARRRGSGRGGAAACARRSAQGVPSGREKKNHRRDRQGPYQTSNRSDREAPDECVDGEDWLVSLLGAVQGSGFRSVVLTVHIVRGRFFWQRRA